MAAVHVLRELEQLSLPAYPLVLGNDNGAGDNQKSLSGAENGCQQDILRLVVELLKPREDATRITGEDAVWIVRSFGRGMVQQLLDRRGDEVEITAQILEAAAQNETNGPRVFRLLLDRLDQLDQLDQPDQPRDRVEISEGVLTAMAQNGESGAKIFRLLLERRGNEVKITQGVLMALAKNPYGWRMYSLVVERWGREVPPTEGFLLATQNNWRGMPI